MHKMVVNPVMLTMGLKQSQQAAVPWRDSGKPIPEGEEARELIRQMNQVRINP